MLFRYPKEGKERERESESERESRMDGRMRIGVDSRFSLRHVNSFFAVGRSGGRGSGSWDWDWDWNRSGLVLRLARGSSKFRRLLPPS